MRLDPLYRVTFSTPESWSVRLDGEDGSEGLTHVTDDSRYAWLNDRQCAVAGDVRPKAYGEGFDVVIEVAELVWEPLGQTDTDSAGSMPAQWAPASSPPD
jgi:hypothetical protein